MGNILGQSLVGNIHTILIDVDPTIMPGVPSPIGSVSYWPNGVNSGVFQKFGPADTDWRELLFSGGPGALDWALAGNLLTGAGPDTPNEILGSLNDFDVVMVRNNIEVARLQNDPITGSNNIRQVIDPDSLAGTPAFVSRMAFPKVTTVGAVTTTVDIPIPTGYAGMIESKISARTAAGGTIGFVRTDQVSNLAGVVTNPFSQNDYTYAPGLESVTAAPSAGNLRLTLTGSAGNTYRWFVSSELVIVST